MSLFRKILSALSVKNSFLENQKGRFGLRKCFLVVSCFHK